MGEANPPDEPTMAGSWPDRSGASRPAPPGGEPPPTIDPGGGPPTALGIESTLPAAPDEVPAGPGATIDRPEAPGRTARGLPEVAGYEVEAEIGRGGMGVVYRARRVRLNRTVALKMILAGDLAGSDASDRFLAEAEAIARIQHPHIVQIFHIDEHQGRPFFEMEYVDGGSLADKLDGRPRPPAFAAGLVARLARAVAEAHRAGIVHRDLKPANILLAADGTPKVADFGLAKSLSDDSGLTRTDSILGTPTYMAPEQAEGRAREVGAAADVYALGAILYEQLTGRPPLVGATVLDTLQQVKSNEPVAPSRLVPGLPRDVETIALKCLEKSPARRYGSASALADDLDRFAEGSPILARPVPFWERGWKWARRRPAVAALWLVLVGSSAALLGMGAVSYLRIQEALGEARDGRAGAIKAHVEEEAARRRAEADRADADAARLAALAETYRASISESRALRAAHRPGWRVEALGILSRLGGLPTPRRDPAELRTEAVAGLGESDVREVARLEVPRDEAFGLAFLDDNRTLATAHHAGAVRLWDVEGPSHLATFSPDAVPGPAWGWPSAAAPWPSVARRPGGAGLIFNSRAHGVASVGLPALRTDRPPVDRPRTPSRAISLDAAGRRLAVGWADGRVDVLDAATGAPVASDRVESPRAFALSPDGGRLALADPGHAIRIRPVEGDAPPATLGRHRATVLAAAFSPDGSTLATGSADHTVQLWDVARGEPRFPLIGHKQSVQAVAFSPDGEWIATASSDHTVRLWEARSGRELAVLEQPSFAVAVAFSPGGDHLAASCVFDGSVRLYRISGRRERRRLVGHGSGLERLATHPTLPRMASGDVAGTIILWDTAEGRPVRRWAGQSSFIASMAFSPDGSTLATGAGQGDPNVNLWDPGTGRRLRSLPGHRAQVTAVAFDGDGRRVATATYGGLVRFWDAATGAALGDGIQLPAHVTSLASTADGRWLAQVHHQAAWVVDASGAAPPRALEGPVGGTILALDPARSRAFFGGNDGSLSALSLPGMAPIRTAGGTHQGTILCLTLSPDGKLVASGGEDRRVVLSDAETLRPLLRFPPRIGRVKSIAFDASGATLAIGGIDSEAELWDLGLIRDELAGLGLAWDGPSPGLGPARAPGPLAGPLKVVASAGPVDPADIARAEAPSGPDPLGAAEILRRVARANLDDPRAAGRLAHALRRLAGVPGLDPGRAAAALEESRSILEGLADPSPAELFDLACLLGRAGLADRAVAALLAATGRGLPAPLDPDAEPDLAPIRGRAEIRAARLDRGFPRDPFVRADPPAASPGPGPARPSVGLGITTEASPVGLRVVRLVPGGPAELDGRIRPGDTILGAGPLPPDLGGPEGSTARLVVRGRDGRDDVRTLTRRRLREPAWFRRLDELDRAVAKSGDDPAVRVERAQVLAAREDWAGALADLGAAIRLDPTDHGPWYQAAPLFLAVGDRAGYRQHCRALLDRFGATFDGAIAERSAKACLLVGEPPVEPSRLVALADRAMADPAYPGFLPYFQLCRGIAEYRAGRPRAASQWLAPLTGAGQPAICDALADTCLAMTEHTLGEGGQARIRLRRAARGPLFAPREDADSPYDPLWHDRLMGRIFLQEADAVIRLDPAFPANPLAR